MYHELLTKMVPFLDFEGVRELESEEYTGPTTLKTNKKPGNICWFNIEYKMSGKSRDVTVKSLSSNLLQMKVSLQ